MADALSVIPASVLRNLSDKLYEKRKNAALEVEGIVKQLAAAGDHDKITSVINLLIMEFTLSAQANYRKGGLIGLAAATVGLTTEAAQHLDVRGLVKFNFYQLLFVAGITFKIGAGSK
ncbi:protein VAC14 homolog [Corylus avellana]|uniref:protein VAC14 homolog n=1 Tax=Corylus avellana TaxID=13451 RepID=UPI00286D5C57|nr:protein VAC14 homolog [Corylus avellana]